MSSNRSKYTSIVAALRTLKKVGQRYIVRVPAGVSAPVYNNRLSAALTRGGILQGTPKGTRLSRSVSTDAKGNQTITCILVPC